LLRLPNTYTYTGVYWNCQSTSCVFHNGLELVMAYVRSP
jgi:hypothetical protein